MRFGASTVLNRLGLKRNATDTGSVFLKAPDGQATDIDLTLPNYLPVTTDLLRVSNTGTMDYLELPSGLEVIYSTSSNSYNIPADATLVLETGTYTEHRVVTLPPAADVAVGREIEIRNIGQRYGGCLDVFIFANNTDILEYAASYSPIIIPWGAESVTVTRMDFSKAGTHWAARSSTLVTGQNRIISDQTFTNSGQLYSPEYVSSLTGANTFAHSSTLTTIPTLVISSGTTNTGRGSVRTIQNIRLGLGEISCKMLMNTTVASSDSTAYRLTLGLSTSNTVSPTVTSVSWQYTHNENSGFMTGVCNDGVDSTIRVSNVEPTTAQFNELAFWINAQGTEVRFFVEGIQLGDPVTTHIPSTSTDMLFDFRNQKSIGVSSNRNVQFNSLTFSAPLIEY